MKRIEAIIQPFKLQDVKEAIVATGAIGMTIEEVKGFGHQKGHTEVYRGSEFKVDYLPKCRILVYTPDAMADSMVEAIQNAARTNSIGDGKIFVSAVSEATRIRTGETGEDAL